MANYTSMYASGQAVDQALQRGEEAWTKINSGEVGGGKIEMLYNGTNITVDGAVVNFKQIVDYLTVDNKFTYLLYNNMAYLTTKIDTTSSLKQVVFESSHVDGGMGKIFTITVNSSDGVTIASINHTNVANENYSNKVSTIAENDKKSTVHYPSNKAVTDITDELKEDLSKLKEEVGGGKVEITPTDTDVELAKRWHMNPVSFAFTRSASDKWNSLNLTDISNFKVGTKIKIKASVIEDASGAFILDENLNVLDYVTALNAEARGYLTSNTPQAVELNVVENAKYIVSDIRNTYYTSAEQFKITGYIKSKFEEITDTVNAKISAVENDISDIGLNNVPFGEFTEGYVRSSDGILRDSHATLKRTDYIDVKGCFSIEYPEYYSGSQAGSAFYDKDKNFISGHAIGDESAGHVITLDVPQNAYYFACTCNGGDVDKFFIRNKNVLMELSRIREAVGGKSDNPLDNIVYDGGLTNIFKTMAVLGDSLASGTFNQPENAGGEDEGLATSITDYTMSWIQMIARRIGNTAFNISKGGADTNSFLSSKRADLDETFAEMLENSTYDSQCYFIALGHNDKNHSIPLGSPSDIGTDVNTYYANYARIISKVQQHHPFSKIFLVTMRNETDSVFAQFNTAIRYMPSVFTKNVYILDMAEYTGVDVPEWMKTGTHGNAIGYYIYSQHIVTLVNDYIMKNPEQFNCVQLIGSAIENAIPDNQNASK